VPRQKQSCRHDGLEIQSIILSLGGSLLSSFSLLRSGNSTRSMSEKMDLGVVFLKVEAF
jgi:hypothetical protein